MKTRTPLFDISTAKRHRLSTTRFARLMTGMLMSVVSVLFASSSVFSQGGIWGMTSNGGANGLGVVFKTDTSGLSYTVVAPFAGSPTGIRPEGDLIQASNGKVYGVSQSGGLQGDGVLFEIDPANGLIVKKVDFSRSETGALPVGRLIEVGGKLYGTAYTGGGVGYGTLFEYDLLSGSFTTRVNFTHANGSRPSGTMILAGNGKLYGTTEEGGATGEGTLFEYDPATSTHTKKFDFSMPTSGFWPKGLVAGDSGKCYGLTNSGGANNLGVLYEYNVNTGAYTKRHDFVASTGGSPLGSMIRASNGKFYGLASGGGASASGVIFKYERYGAGYSKVYDFGGLNGISPNGSLIEVNEKLYGMTSGGGAGGTGFGVLFKFHLSSGTYTKLHDFVFATGSQPRGSLLRVLQKQSQTINFDTLSPRIFGRPPFRLDGVASSGLPVQYTSSNTSVAIISHDTLKIIGTGSTVITASQPGDAQFWAATPVQQTFVVISQEVPDVYVTLPQDGATDVNLSTNITARTVPGASVYTIQLSETSDFAEIAFQASSSQTTISFSGLTYNTRYYNRVITNLSAQPGSVKSFTTRTSESLSYVYAPGDGSESVDVALNITANEVPGASSYTIELSESPDFSDIDFSNTSTTRTMGFSGLKYDTRYYNRVKTDLSVNPGPVKSFTTKSAESLAYVYAPGDRATNVNTSTNITANDVPGASGYTIQLSESSDFSTIHFQGTSSSRTIAFDGLKYNTRYFNRVITDLSPVPGPVQSFTTKGADALTFVYAPGNGAMNLNTSLNITANQVPGAVSYTIQLSEFPDFNVIHFQEASSSRTMAFSGLKYNTIYYNRVITNLSPTPGPVRNFRTRPAESLSYVYAPGNGATNVSVSPNITANLVPGASSYNIQLSETPDFSVIAFEGTSASRSIPFSGLENNMLYYNRVRTNLSPNFGPVRSFRTKVQENFLMSKSGTPSGARLAGGLESPDVGTDLSAGMLVEMFPNPFRDKLSVFVTTVAQQPLAIRLLDMTGKEVYGSGDHQTNSWVEITQPLGRGIYLLNVQVGKERRVMRVVKVE